MAIMYPDVPHEFSPASREGIMFDCLKKLSDEYYVFHSFKIINIRDNTIWESETDFVIFNPSKGILCLEAKAGQVKYEDGKWKYGSGYTMEHGGPYRQASNSKWRLIDHIKSCGHDYLLGRCKLLHAVWFPSVRKEYFANITLPSDADIKLTLTADSFENIEHEISTIFDIKLKKDIGTQLTSSDVKKIVEDVLAPSFNLIPIANMKLENQRIVFKRMLNEQVALLNYLDEQNSAVINGLAGTGKTIMAVEKAKRHAENGEAVLFLCYNAYLKEYLQKAYAHQNVFYYTIDGLACKLCDTIMPNYDMLKETLENMYLDETFPYKHIIVDEGQDFGKERLNDISIIELLKNNVVEEGKNGSFYLFYDKNQMIQSASLPSYIDDADCRLTLYRNCRNTENIAITSLRLLGSDKRPKLFDGAVIGDSPEMFFVDDISQAVSTVNYIVENVWKAECDNIQILTCKTEETSIIADECSTGIYLYKTRKIPFTTCRKYKGLEADVVIMVDLDNDVFTKNAEQIMYVGASRARHKLFLVANIDDAECGAILDTKSIRKAKNVKKAFAATYNAKFRELK